MKRVCNLEIGSMTEKSPKVTNTEKYKLKDKITAKKFKIPPEWIFGFLAAFHEIKIDEL